MLKNLAAASLLTCAAMAAVCCTQMNDNGGTAGTKPSTMTPAVKNDPSKTPAGSTSGTPNVAAAVKGLKDAYAGKFLIGTCAEYGGYSDAEAANIKANYNQITPENSMKPDGLHSQEATYTFTRQDNLVQWCTENGIKVHGHTLAWHSQTPGWFFQGGKEAVAEHLHQHINTVVGHYKGKLFSWDVFNEAINDQAGGLNGAENLRRSQWMSTVGPEILTQAFKWARAADPDVKLYYNDYNIEQGASTNSGKHAASLALLKRLKADGAPITGVGIQGHWHLDTKLADVEQAIKNYEELGLKISISELDVTSTGGNSGALGGQGGGTITDAAVKKQAEVFGELFAIFARHSNSIERVTLWGISDTRSWRRGQGALLFDGQMNPKPSYQAVMDVGMGKWTPPAK